MVIDKVLLKKKGQCFPAKKGIEKVLRSLPRDMYELAKMEYGKVLPIFENIEINRPAVFGVIEGNTPGRIFIDHREKPTTTFIFVGNWGDNIVGRGNEKNVFLPVN